MLRVVWTCDDFGTDESAEHVRPIMSLLDRVGCKGVLMVVPHHQGRPLHEKAELCCALEEAMAQGHELAMHGFSHYNFECGVMPDFLLQRDPKNIKDLEENGERIRSMHSLAEIASRLEQGVEIWEKTFSMRPKVFRAPCLSVHENLFPSLKSLGFECDSSLAVNPTLWRYLEFRKPLPNKWNDDPKPLPFEIVPGLLEFPLTGDYTVRIADDEIPYMMSVALEDASKCESLDAPFVILSHWWAIPQNDRAGYRFWESLFDRWRDQGDVGYATLGQLAGEMRASSQAKVS